MLNYFAMAMISKLFSKNYIYDLSWNYFLMLTYKNTKDIKGILNMLPVTNNTTDLYYKRVFYFK